jgi:hypothetical protein
MDLEHVPASRPLVKLVYILRDDRCFGTTGDGAMASVGFGLCNQGTTPVIPFPNKLWISREGLRGGKFFSAEVAP